MTQLTHTPVSSSLAPRVLRGGRPPVRRRVGALHSATRYSVGLVPCHRVGLRRFLVSFAAAILASLLFSFLPYKLIRTQAHLFLTAYYLVPLMVLVVLWLYLRPALFFGRDEQPSTWRFRPFGARPLGTV